MDEQKFENYAPGYYFYRNSIINVLDDSELADKEVFAKTLSSLYFVQNWVDRFIRHHGQKNDKGVYKIDKTTVLALEKIANEFFIDNIDKTKELINQIPTNLPPKVVLKILKAYEMMTV